MEKVVLITPPSFSKTDPAPLELLERNGWRCIRNSTGSAYSKEEMIRQVRQCSGLILGVDPCDREVLEAADRLKVVSRYGVGTDNVDTRYMQERGISFFRTVGVNADAVADTAFALMIGASKKLAEVDRDIRQGKWYEAETFELYRKTLGLVGFGNIGARVAKRAAGFDMRVVAFDPYPNKALAEQTGVELLPSLETLLDICDIVSLHLPLGESTYHLIGPRELERMRPGSILVNTARGGIVDEDALADALETGHLLGAGLDVFEQEPLPPQSRLMGLRNIILSPHSAADTYETTQKVSLAAAENLIKGYQEHA